MMMMMTTMMTTMMMMAAAMLGLEEWGFVDDMFKGSGTWLKERT